MLGLQLQAAHRQLDLVLAKALQFGETQRGHKLAIDTQMAVPALARPIGQFGVEALAPAHQRRQQTDVLAPKTPHQLPQDGRRALRLHRAVVVDAVLGAELDVEQAQVMPDFGHCADSRFAPAAREPLLDRHRGRYAVHGIDVGPPGRLHDAARVGVEAL